MTILQTAVAQWERNKLLPTNTEQQSRTGGAKTKQTQYHVLQLARPTDSLPTSTHFGAPDVRSRFQRVLLAMPDSQPLAPITQCSVRTEPSAAAVRKHRAGQHLCLQKLGQAQSCFNSFLT